MWEKCMLPCVIGNVCNSIPVTIKRPFNSWRQVFRKCSGNGSGHIQWILNYVIVNRGRVGATSAWVVINI